MTIQSFTYTEGLKSTIVGPGVTIAAGTLVIDSTSFDLGTQVNSGPTNAFFTLGMPATAVNKQSISVHITNQVTAVGTGPGTTHLQKGVLTGDVLQQPEFSVTFAPVPLPPAAWMLGSALVGLVTVGRRKLGV